MSVNPSALVLAPRGRDTAIAVALLESVGVTGSPVSSLDALVAALCDDVSVVLVTEEEVTRADLRGFDRWLTGQPAWSDLPVVVLSHAGSDPERNPEAARLLELLGNVSFLERPFHPTTFTSVVKAAIRARQRQYEARGRLLELAENQERLRTALLAGNLGSWELDLATMSLDTSTTCRAAFGRPSGDLFDYSELLNAVHSDDRDRMQAAISQTIRSATDFETEYRTIWPDGTEHWVEMHGRPILSSDGRPAKIVGVSSDITERKTFEQRLVSLNESLEQRVVERTTALEEAHERAIDAMAQREDAVEQLIQAQKVESIGQLTGGVAHDFNNLLMAVLGNLEVLRRHVGGDERAVRLIEGALEGAKRGASLTQRLLAFARKQELEVKETNLFELIGGLSALMRQSVGQGIDIVIASSSIPPVARVDANQIELAMLNLVVNARDAMPDGGTITIDVSDVTLEKADADLGAGRYIRVSVSDTGKGMDAETLRRAVEPFFSTKGVGKGTGLGLSMIHGLVVQLGGAFRLTSAVGQGTVATMLLPAADPGNLDLTDSESSEPIAPEAAARSSILVVDDDMLIAMSTVAMVEDLGHSVLEANSGADALEIIRGGAKIDLMITDFSMPKMSGAELIQAARLLRPDLPIILASGYAELPGDIKLDVARLGKPYEQRQLAAQINLALAPRRNGHITPSQ